MDAKTFDALVARIFRGSSRRETVKGVLAGAVAASVPALAEAKNKKGKDKHRKGKSDKAETHDEGTDKKGKRQVSAEAKKKNFCLCKGTSQAQCNATTCVNCEFQEQIGRKARKRIRKQFPFSFVVDAASECPGTTTTTTSTTTSTTTTRGVCGGSCNVGTNTCGDAGNTCVCRGSSVIPGSPGTCSTAAVTCSGQTCITGAANPCAGLGANCVCNADGPPGTQGTCGQATTTTTPPAPTTCPGGTCSGPNCQPGCACVSNVCVACVADGGTCTAGGDVCCTYLSGTACVGGVCTVTTTTTTTTPPPMCPAGRVELSNGTCALPCTGSMECTNIGCGGCIGTATGDFCRDGAGPVGPCATDNDCPQGQFCVTGAGPSFTCTGACPANAV